MRKNSYAATYITRSNVLELLSDAEVARVSSAETKPLSPGEQYVDLEHLEAGVLTATPTGPAPTAHLLPKRCVGDATWRHILNALSAPLQAAATADAPIATALAASVSSIRAPR